MLKSLIINNIVLIDKAEIEFDAGLCILSGETGSGKSILLDALGLAIGFRSNSKLLGSHDTKANVIAEFDISLNPQCQEILVSNEIINNTNNILNVSNEVISSPINLVAETISDVIPDIVPDVIPDIVPDVIPDIGLNVNSLHIDDDNSIFIYIGIGVLVILVGVFAFNYYNKNKRVRFIDEPTEICYPNSTSSYCRRSEF